MSILVIAASGTVADALLPATKMAHLPVDQTRVDTWCSLTDTPAVMACLP